MASPFRLVPEEYGDYFAGIWLLDQKWVAENSEVPTAIIFYAFAYYKKFGILPTEDGGFVTEVEEFTYFTQGNRIASFPMNVPLGPIGTALTQEQVDAASSDWKYDGRDLWIHDGDWLQFHPSSLNELVEVGFDQETIVHWGTIIGLQDPDFLQPFDKLPLPGKKRD